MPAMVDIIHHLVRSGRQRQHVSGGSDARSCAVGAGKRTEIGIEAAIFLNDEYDVLNHIHAGRAGGYGARLFLLGDRTRQQR